EVADGTPADSQDGGQGQDDEAEEGGSSKGAGQRVEEGAGRFGHGLLDALKFTAGGAGLASHSPAAFEVAATALGTALATTAGLGGRAAAPRSGYTGHGSLLGVNVGQLPSLHQV